jgi:hypothetical protein
MTGTEDPWVVRGTIAAIGAAVIALASLIAILFQISLAKKEIDLVQQDLENAKAVLDYAKEQSALVNEQMAELQRKPDIYVCFEDGRDLETASIRPGTLGNVMLYAINRGERTSNNLFVEVFVPMDILTGPVKVHGPRFTINGVTCVRIPLGARSSLWPSDVAEQWKNLQLDFAPGDHSIYWNAFDDFGRYPKNGRGKLLLMLRP